MNVHMTSSAGVGVHLHLHILVVQHSFLLRAAARFIYVAKDLHSLLLLFWSRTFLLKAAAETSPMVKLRLLSWNSIYCANSLCVRVMIHILSICEHEGGK